MIQSIGILYQKCIFLLIAAVDVNVQTCTKLQTWPKPKKAISFNESRFCLSIFIYSSLFIYTLFNQFSFYFRKIIESAENLSFLFHLRVVDITNMNIQRWHRWKISDCIWILLYLIWTLAWKMKITRSSGF